MAYGDFTLVDLREKYGIKNHRQPLFESLPPLPPSEFLDGLLAATRELPMRTEKAKSENIVFPILLELVRRNQKFFTIYSGENLNIDDQLKGECDFILAKDIGSFDLDYPIIQIVEAKRGEIELGVPQCAAQMVGAKRFNEKNGIQLERMYGCVTNGNDWLFIRLEGDLFIDRRVYFLNELNELRAVFQTIIDYYKTVLN